MSRLDLVVGPNGAGKSTFVAKVIAPSWPAAVFVNADEIARERWPDSAAEHSYEAARIASRTRQRLIELHRPFIAETVFSHPSKLELLQAARAGGYYVALHVILVPEELSVSRVAHRVLAGGHDVPEEKIRARYHRIWPLVVSRGRDGRLGELLGQRLLRRPAPGGLTHRAPGRGATQLAQLGSGATDAAMAS